MTPAERRRLNEIRQQLADEDPGLSRLLATGRRSASPAFAGALGAFLIAVTGSLLLGTLGAELHSPSLALVGGLFVISVPALLAALSRRRS
ncbi:DUF3040 domain-containing protein [Amycolatopsis sp. NPDC004169]|uniref:DUF3040 domain-containing protein n=1 Tax=Amycolatopsis sp. NPDC004169 TaxID=3154453 RepID=UPI0033A06CD7